MALNPSRFDYEVASFMCPARCPQSLAGLAGNTAAPPVRPHTPGGALWELVKWYHDGLQNRKHEFDSHIPCKRLPGGYGMIAPVELTLEEAFAEWVDESHEMAQEMWHYSASDTRDV